MSSTLRPVSAKGVVFDIQRFCIEDGPGIRTSIFLKGCQLRCPWCANPESLSPKPQLAHFHSRCELCGACVQICEPRAITMSGHTLIIDRAKCSNCGRCASVCPAQAMKMIGRVVRCSEVIDECIRDKPFYEESGGGITLTGGEPTLQETFCEALLEEAKDVGIHTAIETNGYCRWSTLKRLAKHTDLFLFDLKIVENTAGKSINGADSEIILGNLRRLGASGSALIVRFPFVPGYTDNEPNIERILEVASRLGNGVSVEVLPFHQYGKHKYDALGYEYALRSCLPVSREEVQEKLAKFGHRARVKVLG